MVTFVPIPGPSSGIRVMGVSDEIFKVSLRTSALYWGTPIEMTVTGGE